MLGPARILLLPALSLSLTGCATAWARGIVRDQEGRPIPGASIVLSPAGSAVASSTGISEHNGCFDVSASATKEQATFILNVRASGYKDLSDTFPRRDRLTAVVTLLPEGQPGTSSLSRVPASEERKTYEEPCLPTPVPDAMSLTLH